MTEFSAPELSLSTTTLMSWGGDDRITLDERSGLNSYGCSPKPTATLGYSSSTASFIGAGAFAHVTSLHHQLREAVREGDPYSVYERYLTATAARLQSCYDLPESADIVFGPSGTDLEYIALACSLQVSSKVCNIVVEVDEVGSGCQHSQAGRYFAPRTALGLDVTKGDALPGFEPGSIRVETVPMRSASGAVICEEAHADLLDVAIRNALASGERPLLHVVHRSKTGLVLPSWPVLERLAKTHSDDLDIVVDACQGRISPAMIARYLDCNASLLLTGSKFIGGPPFSGFAILSPSVSTRMRAADDLPRGLAAFFSRAELSHRWPAAMALDPVANFGLLLRMEAGLFELERLLALDNDRVGAVIGALTRVMEHLPDDLPFQLHSCATSGSLPVETGHPLDSQSLFVIAFKDELLADCPIDFDDARMIYRMLYSDLSDRFSDPQDQITAADICHLGQPVRCLRHGEGWRPTLRISLSAGQIADLSGLSPERLETRFRSDIARIGAKIRLAVDLLKANRAPENFAAIKALVEQGG
ncbi:hypothetical protein [Erythrobacter sp. YT30]|uniref:hypothetical protein n=1 Tax=Erythrobacter sp. YT30 TaxID=1735012 RepID=UPI00076BFA7C|nr:hypothetical protein [Erythrobacter sp. YT30]KWV93068.1 hypothetical protein AUC45_02770 [Erythrobacter sp. YT30]